MFFPSDVVEAQSVNTVVAGNTAPVGRGCYDAGAVLTSLGHNLEDADTCNFTRASDQVNANAALGPLQDNGGPTLTHTLLPGSQAIDAGNNAMCPGPRSTASTSGSSPPAGRWLRHRVIRGGGGPLVSSVWSRPHRFRNL